MELLGRSIAALIRPGDIVTLSGGLGAGKTTIARGILRGLGFEGEVPSPTFAILQGYDPPETRLPVGHVDLYRIEEPEELAELGLDDWLEQGVLLVEWPDRLHGALDADALALEIAVDEDGVRHLTARPGRGWESRWPLR